MAVKMTGNWNRVGRLIEVELPGKISAAARRVMYENARIYQEEVVRIIEEQDGDWKPLTEQWADHKENMGASDDFFRFTDGFLDYLKSDRARQFVKGRYAESRLYFGARNDVIHEGFSKSAISMYRLAVQLEERYGRPLFSMAYERTKSQMEKNWKKIAEESGMRWR
jgi:hypothetical protein